MYTCQRCGSEFTKYRSPSDLRMHGAPRYCSRKCLITPRERQRSCLDCGTTFDISIHHTNQRYCSRKCSYKHVTRPKKSVWAYVFWAKSKQKWLGVLKFTDGRPQLTVSGATEREVKIKLALRQAGLPSSGKSGTSRARLWNVPTDTIRYALSLLLPLDHLMRWERQQQAVAILEEAIRFAEAGLDSPAPQQSVEAPAMAPARHRPAWLDALPVHQETA